MMLGCLFALPELNCLLFPTYSQTKIRLFGKLFKCSKGRYSIRVYSDVIEDIFVINADYKILLAGDESVGKTSLIRRLVKNEFALDYKPTLGFEITSHSLQIKNIQIRLVIWDIAGQTSFESVRRSYYQGSQGFLLVFNLANRISLRNLEYWTAEIKEVCPNAPLIILGNKSDLPDHKVTVAEMQKMAQKLGAFGSIMTSAKTGQGVQESFIMLGTAILDLLQPRT